MTSIQIKNLKKQYGTTTVLEDINLDISVGEFVVLIGASGCGKSTLLRMIAGLESITEGSILVNGVLYNTLPPAKRDISMVFQSYALYPHLNVYNNIAYGMKVRKCDKREISEKVTHVSKTLNISQLMDRLPKDISGGQRQRVAMGRAIVRDPAMFLFDEPLSNLDAKLRVVMRKEIKQIQKRLKTTTIYVTHDQVEAMTMADKIVLMDKGHIVQSGTPEELFDNPNSIFCASFLGSPGMTLLEGTIMKHGDELVFTTLDGLKLPVRQSKNLSEGRKVVLGIRPRDFTLCAESEGFTIHTELLEYTGAEYIVYGMFGNNEMTIVLSRKDDFNSKCTALSVKYDVSKIHIFDQETGRAI